MYSTCSKNTLVASGRVCFIEKHHFFRDETMQMSGDFEAFSLNGALFGLVM